MVRALVLGDQGFLGRHFSQELTARGYQVTGLDVKRAPSQDCRLYFQANPTVEYDLVVHCAAVIGGRRRIERAPLATAANLSIDAELFRWAAIAHPRRLLYISSSAAYPICLQEPGEPWMQLRESDFDLSYEPFVGQPDEVYGWSKVMGEVLAQKLRSEGVKVTVVRPFSGYGPEQDVTYPFPAFIARALAHEDPFRVWGSGEQVRDFIHVDDLVQGALEIVKSGTPDPVNLCTGRGVSFTELADLVCEGAGYHPRIERLWEEPSGVAYRVGSTRVMEQYYVPKITIEEGIRRALREAG